MARRSSEDLSVIPKKLKSSRVMFIGVLTIVSKDPFRTDPRFNGSFCVAAVSEKYKKEE